MALNTNLPMGYRGAELQNPLQALMQVIQLENAQQGNALQRMQMQRATQQQEQAAQQKQARQRYLASVSGQAGPPAEFNALTAFGAGFKPEEIKALQPPKPPGLMNVGAGGAVFDPATMKPVFTAPFKTEAHKLPQIAELQSFRDSLPPNDPRRREVQGVIDNQTRPPKFATPGAGPVARPAAAGPATGVPMADDRAELSARLGVPVAERDPYAGMSPRAAETFKRTLYTAADKKMNDFADASAAARAMAQDAKRFVELQGSVSMQGPIAGRVIALSSEAQDMDAITARITPQMRQPGSGATSDFDAKMFQMATVGRTKNEGANKAIAEGIALNSQVTQEREQFMRDYLSVNGHLDGAERQWKRYADKNPIFDPKSPAVPALNQARVPYQQFFGAGVAVPNSASRVPFESPAAPARPTAAIQTATNPKTGEKLKLVNGQWVPFK